ncbi:MAG: xanthine dehydrogenase family protein molybdopterin-binding subunit [Deltaproteobacteria bacterium]|nr:xanthine dehydrogenase family protein molybdopterin-binding subunit [Deltaproteobacteria bacterium]
MGEIEYRYVGKNVARKGAVERVTGAGIYCVDLVVPGMIYGRVLRSEYAHARILNIDIAEAESIPGVHAVITSKDAPAVTYGRTLNDRWVLAKEKVFFIGDPVAAVAAESDAIAKAALKKIKVSYEPLPPVLDPERAMNQDSVSLHEEIPLPPNLPEGQNVKNVCSYTSVHYGDADKAMAEADMVVEDTYETQMVHPQYLEPRTVLARYDSDGKFTLWINAQTPFAVRSQISRLLQIPANKVRVIVTEIGGGFGGKASGVESSGSLEPICALLALKAKKPVRMALEKSEETIATSVRGPSKIWIQSGVKRDGTIVARKGRVIFDCGGYQGCGGSAGGKAARMLAGWYRLPNVHVDGYTVYTNKQVCGSVRGPGGVQGTFAVESHMDSIAAKLRMDPVDLRLQNMPRAGERLPNGAFLRNVSLRESLLRAAEKIGWGQANLKKNQGIGFASTMWGEGAGPGSGALVKVNEDATAIVLVGKVDYGTAIPFAIPMIVAEELGIPLDDVTVLNVDTDTSPWDFGTVGSRTTVTCGGATRLAAIDARDQLLAIAAKLLGAEIGQLEAKDRQIRIIGSSDKSLPMSAVATAAHFQVGEVIGRGYYNPEVIQAEEREKGVSPVYATHAALVEVDPDTGRVLVKRYVAVHDLGFVIHPDGAEGQIEGGVVEGLGQALCEQILVSDRGETLNPTFVDYLMPTLSMTPKIEPILLEGYRGPGPYGAKGVGEVPCLLTPAAIANAIYNAVGVRIRTLPLTPENVLRSLRNRG